MDAARDLLQRAPVPARATSELLDRYVAAWEAADLQGFVALLTSDATLEMPPMPVCLRGVDAIARAVGGMVMRPGDAGRFRLRSTEANGQPALVAWERGPDGDYRLASLHVLTVREGRICGMVAFMEPALFGSLELPAVPPETGA